MSGKTVDRVGGCNELLLPAASDCAACPGSSSGRAAQQLPGCVPRGQQPYPAALCGAVSIAAGVTPQEAAPQALLPRRWHDARCLWPGLWHAV